MYTYVDRTGRLLRDLRRVGFVSFKSHDAANNAVRALHGTIINGRRVYCGLVQKNEDETKKQGLFYYCTWGKNVYIKNLEDEVDDELLRKSFSKFGNITSSKVMRFEDGRTKGFGFVCFSSCEDADKAITEMNGCVIVSKPLYVGLAQNKQERAAQLAALRMKHASVLKQHPCKELAAVAAASRAVPTQATVSDPSESA